MTRQLHPMKWRLAHSWRSVLCTQLLYLFANESLHFLDDGPEDRLELSAFTIVIDSSASNKTYTYAVSLRRPAFIFAQDFSGTPGIATV
jgi:hypothetical protein